MEFNTKRGDILAHIHIESNNSERLLIPFIKTESNDVLNETVKNFPKIKTEPPELNNDSDNIEMEYIMNDSIKSEGVVSAGNIETQESADIKNEFFLPNDMMKNAYCRELLTVKEKYLNGKLKTSIKKLETFRKCRCPFCKKYFLSSKQCKTHIGCHFRKQCEMCLFCGKFLYHRLHFVNHFFVYHFLKTKSKVFKYIKDNMRKNTTINSDVLHFKSETCTIESNTIEKEYKRNIYTKSLRNSKEKPFECKNCLKTFTQSSQITLHMKTHIDKKPYQRNCLTEHMKTKTREKLYKCEICSYPFSTRFNLKTHMKIHTGEKPFQCNICWKTFTQNRKLKIHMRIHTGEKPYQCNVCSKSFIRRDHLTYHMAVHTGENLYKCEICSYATSRRFSLTSHMKIHTKELPLECEICTKKFSHIGNLKVHMLTHTSEKLFKCDICSKTFLRNSYLKKHLQTHLRETIFECEICSKTYSRNYNLTAHMATHTEDNQFKCDVCLKSFGRYSYLKLHQIVHTEEKAFKCEMCSKTFRRPGDLLRHTKNHNRKKNI